MSALRPRSRRLGRTRRLAPLGALAVLATALAACGGAAAGTPLATRAPFSDPSEAGYIGLCDAHGHQVTSGSLDTDPFAWRAVSSVAAPAQYAAAGRTATLYAYQANEALAPGEWSGEQLTASSRYTNPAHPMAEATVGDGSLADFVSDFHPQWDGFVELRLYLGAPGQSPASLRYPALAVQVTGDTWHAVGGGTVDCSAGSAQSIESVLLPSSSLTPPSSSTSSTS
jgi:hypothetical protein